MRISIIAFSLIISIVSCLEANTLKPTSENKMCNFFLIKEVRNEVHIEKVTLTEGQVQVFNDESLLSYVMVFSPGSKSGELIQQSQRVNGIVTQFSNSTIKVSILNKDGTQREMPVIDLKDATNSVVRFNITGVARYKQP